MVHTRRVYQAPTHHGVYTRICLPTHHAWYTRLPPAMPGIPASLPPSDRCGKEPKRPLTGHPIVVEKSQKTLNRPSDRCGREPKVPNPATRSLWKRAKSAKTGYPIVVEKSQKSTNRLSDRCGKEPKEAKLAIRSLRKRREKKPNWLSDR